MALYTVGLTGGIGSGKTTVTKLFEQLGITIVDADVIARACVAPNSKALQQIVIHFGEPILTATGELNRALLRTIVFNDYHEKQWLNNLLHPLIRQTLIHQLALANGPYVILVAPLLLEHNLHTLVDRVLVIDVPVQLQLARTIERDSSSPQVVQAIIDSQLSRAERLAGADDVIDNSTTSTSTSLMAKVAALHTQYLSYAQQK